jgi:hypothetical protein
MAFYTAQRCCLLPCCNSCTGHAQCKAVQSRRAVVGLAMAAACRPPIHSPALQALGATEVEGCALHAGVADQMYTLCQVLLTGCALCAAGSAWWHTHRGPVWLHRHTPHMVCSLTGPLLPVNIDHCGAGSATGCGCRPLLAVQWLC